MTKRDEWQRAWRFVRIYAISSMDAWNDGDTPRTLPLFQQALDCYLNRTLAPLLALFARARLLKKVVVCDRSGRTRVLDRDKKEGDR